MIMLSIMAIILIIVYIVNNAEYKKTEYYKHTGTGFLSMRLNKGKYGEFLTYKKLISGIDTIRNSFSTVIYLKKMVKQLK